MAVPQDDSAAAVTEYAREHAEGRLRCGMAEGKGRVLLAAVPWEAGDVVLTEEPLHLVQEEPGKAAFQDLVAFCEAEELDENPVWYWAALRSLTLEELGGVGLARWAPLGPERQRRLRLLCSSGGKGHGCAVARRFAPRLPDPRGLDELVQAWILNGFSFSDRPFGVALFFLASFCSHSCRPNACWHLDADGRFVLRARRRIEAGEEVTIAYLDERALLDCAELRRAGLFTSKAFWCACERCCLPDACRGFSCPGCAVGLVLARPAGPAPGARGLSHQPLVGATCGGCGRSVGPEEAQQLLCRELCVQGLLARWEDAPPTQEDAEQAAELLQGFAQHSLAERAWQQLAWLHGERGRWGPQLELLLASSRFCAAAYPGMSGAHAWALEAYADGLAAAAQRGSGGAGGAGDVGPVLAQAACAYEQALEVLSAMFGGGFGYAGGVRTKLEYVGRLTDLVGA
ncbi:unnamed protein product [Prorocentrum cordatum]|uniref:SET domain-containing protein n=1 Tax=Prorocentrum cordatum TaxID=2364126 RepID=A0ABN9X563_9DINO|nr:unnamed protein product [Polarella glacialis]